MSSNPTRIKKEDLRTSSELTWCPGCPNFMILESSRRAILSLISKGAKKEDFAMGVGIGCHGKIFDYLGISGVYGLHGRSIPTAIGIKLGNPKLKVIAFGGDGDTYSEGISHFIHACRNNHDITLIVHDNRSFSLTTGQATPTSQKGYKSKAEPQGSGIPLNPVHLALASGASFVARCNARDIKHTQSVIEKAINHKGFSFVEILQDCIIFNTKINDQDKNMEQIKENSDWNKALLLAQKFDYDIVKEKIPLGIIYQTNDKEVLPQF